MSQLEQKLKELKTQQEKAGYLRQVLTNLENLPKSENNPQNEPAIMARASVIEELTEIIGERILQIENDETPNTSVGVRIDGLPSDFSPEEVNVLKTLAARAMTRTPERPPVQPRGNNSSAFASDDDDYTPPAPPPRPRQTPPTKHEQREDKISFGLRNRHLDQKRVLVVTKQGIQTAGIVVGLDAPNIVVKTDTGHTIQVPLENVTLE
jgi:hypothetical protein